MPFAAARARPSAARTILWLLSFISAYVLVGTWAFTPELARASIAREISSTAVPPRTQSTKKPSVVRAGGDGRRANATQEGHPRAHGAAVISSVEPSVAIERTRRIPSASGAATARNRNRVLYEALPPPAAD